VSEANYPLVQLQEQVWEYIWWAQTFTPRETHDVEYLSLKLEPILYITGVIASIQYAPGGVPTGADLTANSALWDILSKYPLNKTILFRFSPTFHLVKDIEYAIVLRTIPAYPLRPCFFTYEAPPGHYPRGKLIKSTNSGITWDPTNRGDMFFAEWGDPPAKPSPPSPPLTKFAVVDLTYTHYDVGLTIRLPTNVPCHLTCYYTDKKPLKHPMTRIIRGLKVPWGTYFCFVAWKAVEQTEYGATLYHTFEFPDWPMCPAPTPTPPLHPRKDIAPLWEPWGTTLNENYYWNILADPDPPIITLDKGIITLDFTGTPHSGIYSQPSPGKIPLTNHLGEPLHLLTNNTEVYSINAAETIANVVGLRKGNYIMHLQYNVHSWIAVFITGTEGSPPATGYYWAWWYTGEGTTDRNLLNDFQQAARAIGIDPDPTAWYVNHVELAHRAYLLPYDSYLKNDYICLYYPEPQQINGRYFTFRGEVDLVNVPSVGPIFQHCHPGGLPKIVILRPNAVGDLNQIPQYTPPGIAGTWECVNEVIPDEDASCLWVQLPWTTPYYTTIWNIETADLGKINKVTITARLRRQGGYYYARCGKIALKTHGTIYLTSEMSLFNNYSNFNWEFPLNPFTNEPWTQTEIDDLQIGASVRKYQGVGWGSFGKVTQVYATIERGIEGGPD